MMRLFIFFDCNKRREVFYRNFFTGLPKASAIDGLLSQATLKKECKECKFAGFVCLLSNF